MGFVITYKKLFEVKIWHDYLLNKGETYFDDLEQSGKNNILDNYNIHDYLIVEPTQACAKILKSQRLQFRKNKYGFFIAVEVEKVEQGDITRYKPFIGWDRFFALAFSVRIKHPNFFNFTNLPQEALKNKVFYFSNINTDTGYTYPSLSSVIPRFKSDKYYYPGALILRGSRLMEALIEVQGSSFVNNEWMEIPRKNYFHPEDKVFLKGNYYKYVFENNNLDKVRFKVTNLTGQVVINKEIDINNEDTFFKEDRFTVNDNTIKEYYLSLNDLIPGNYKLAVTGDSFNDSVQFYYDRRLILEKPFALIEIAELPNGQSSDYKLLEPGTGFLREEAETRKFEIRFKNRSTYWFYVFNEEQTGDLGDFESVSEDNKKFVYKSINPLTKFPIEMNKFNTESLLPNPGVNNIYPRRRSYPRPEGALKIYSEIFV